ncbi:MAG: DMT family transporter [Desulfatibacillaceae bacterium]
MIYVKLILMAMFWGGTFIAGRVASQYSGPYTAAFLRFVMASAFLLFVAGRGHGLFDTVKPRHWLGLVLMGMTGVFAYNVFFFSGLKTVEAGRAALIIANNPVIIAVAARILYRELLPPRKALGILLSVTGAVVVITRGHPSLILGETVTIGEVYISLCVASWVAFSLIGKKVLVDLSPLVSITWASIVGAAALLPPAVAEGIASTAPELPLVYWIAVAYLGFFGTALGFVWYYQGIQRIGPARASLFINFVPVSAVLLGWAILDEPLTRSILAGAALVCTGVYLTNLPVKRK